MIDSVSQNAIQQLYGKTNAAADYGKSFIPSENVDSKTAAPFSLPEPGKVGDLSKGFAPTELPSIGRTGGPDPFGSMIGNLVKEVDAKGKTAAHEANKALLGESDNIHQSMIAMQESGLAFTLLVEVRNKLVQSFQELMKMPV